MTRGILGLGGLDRLGCSGVFWGVFRGCELAEAARWVGVGSSHLRG